MQLWQSGRSTDKLNRIHAKHPGIDVDILKQYKLIYQWIRGKDVVETLQDARFRKPGGVPSTGVRFVYLPLWRVNRRSVGPGC